MKDSICNSSLSAAYLPKPEDTPEAQNVAAYRRALARAMEGALNDYLRQVSEDLLNRVTEAAFFEGWLAAGGKPPYIIHKTFEEEEDSRR